MLRNKSNLLYCLVIVVLAFALYANTIPNKYAIDDPMVTNNSLTNQGISAIPEIFTSRYRVTEDYNYGYRPIAKATYALEYEFFFANPHVSHFFNVLIYALLGIVLFLVLHKLFWNYQAYWPFCITILFIAHPVHTEVVASLKNREELLSFLGSLLALYFAMRYIEKKVLWNIFFAILFFTFGYLSKQNTAVFAAIIPLAIYFFSGGLEDKAPFILGAKKVTNPLRNVYPSRASITEAILLIVAIGLVSLGIGLYRKAPIYLALIPVLMLSLRSSSINQDKMWKQLYSPWMIIGFLWVIVAYYFKIYYILLGGITSFLLHRIFKDGVLRAKVLEVFKKIGGKLFQIHSPVSVHVSDTGKQLVVVGVLLGGIGLSLWYLPDQFLPPEQRELSYFENPLFYLDDLCQNIATGFYSLLIYLRLLIFPHPLVFYYGFNHIPIVNISNGWVILSLIVHLFLLVYATVKFRQRHILSFAILYYLIGIFMFSNLVLKIPGIVGERLLFMSSLGFCVAIAFIIFKILKIDPTVDLLPKKSRLKLLLAFGLLLIPYSIKTVARNFNWKDHLTLYTHDIPYVENSLYANSLVASEVLRNINTNPTTASEVTENQQKLELVIKHFKQVLKLDPNHKQALNNLGTVYYNFFQEYETAIPYFQKVLSIDSSFAMAYFNMAYCLDQIGNSNAAVKYYQRAIELRPTDIKSISNLANLYDKLGDFTEAVRLNRDIIVLDSLSDIPYMNMANYYLKRSDEATAVGYFEKAAVLAPDNYKLLFNLSDYFKENGNPQKARYYHDLGQKSRRGRIPK